MKNFHLDIGRQKLLLHTVMLVTLSSMVFVYPFDNQFRITLGVAVLSTLLLSFPQLPAFRLVLASGVSIVLFRAGISLLLGQSSLSSALVMHLPALAYYFTFGVLFELFTIRQLLGNFPLVILLLSLTDALSNMVELLFRPTLRAVGYEMALASVILLALVRSGIAVYGYVVLKQYHSFVLVQEKLKRYSDLMLMIAKLKTELFYLRKSSQDIESVMERSYWLYNRLKQQERTEGGSRAEQNAGKALEIAREIHEVKKDYTRVLAGIENVLMPSSQENMMRFSEVFNNIEQNVLRYIENAGKPIAITFQYDEDFLTDQHYTIVSLLDNLIMNAIEACGDAGNICVSQTRKGQEYSFEVADDGVGIASEELLFVFKPGYSTKFSPETGKMSTGLGLCHVKNLSEDLGGTVSVASAAGKGATFIVSIPVERLACGRKQR
ncbi:MAG: sensor histidine kinase [Sporomusaceae bacterium]|nr:sensor histidine kinase [Sporomusaceae bacterium]